MILGDGAPRRAAARVLDTHPWPVQVYGDIGVAAVNRLRHVPTDRYHIQPDFVTTRYLDAHESGGGTTLFYCSCIKRWTSNPHNCVISPSGPARSQAIRPGARLSSEWITRDIQVVDTSYLDTQMPHLQRGSGGREYQYQVCVTWKIVGYWLDSHTIH